MPALTPDQEARVVELVREIASIAASAAERATSQIANSFTTLVDQQQAEIRKLTADLSALQALARGAS